MKTYNGINKKTSKIIPDVCPVCNMDIDQKCKYCPNCRYQFKE